MNIAKVIIIGQVAGWVDKNARNLAVEYQRDLIVVLMNLWTFKTKYKEV